MNHDQDSLLDSGVVNSISTIRFDNIESQSVGSDSQGPSTNYVPPAIFRQIFAAFSSTLAALSAGVVLGWTSPILDFLIAGHYNNIKIDNDKMGWIGSFVTLGAMATCIPAGFLCDVIGRRKVLLSLMIPFLVGWALIIWAQNIMTLYFGRLITGMAVGACCVAAPLYNGEIAHQEIRGKLGSFFQLMICLGIFLAYVFGKFLTPYQFTWFCASMPFVFFIFFVFQPESPTYLLKRSQYDKAKESLIILRGVNYNVDEELLQIEGYLKQSSHTTISLRSILSRKAVRMAVVISLSLMMFQQLCGINAIILYSSNMFASTGVHLDPNVATIMVGGFQVLATFCASLLIEQLGRKFLLVLSLAVVTISCTILAIYLSVKNYLDADALKEISFLPAIALCLFVVAFSFGLGPIPWMIASDIVPNEIRSLVSSSAGTFNWFLAFMVTKLYLHVAGQAGPFYFFSAFAFIGTIFVLIIVPETKGKSLREIQDDLESIM